MRLAEFGAFRLQHDHLSLVSLASGRRRGGLAAPLRTAAFLGLEGAVLLGHGIVLHDLALEDPHLDADDAIGRAAERRAVIDIGAQCMQRHAALAIPLHARDLCPTEPAAAIDADAERAHAHCRLYGALHGATESDAALELLR